MKSAVIVFPGSNCDRDAAVALEGDRPAAGHGLARRQRPAADVDLIVLPGGFSYGDYLRCGAMAAHSPVMRDGGGARPRAARRCSASATASRS